MKRLYLVGVICLTMGHALGTAQRASLYGTFGDLRSLQCANWSPSSALTRNGFDRDLWLKHAPEHAWVYGFITGAGLYAQDVGGPYNGAADANRYASG
jgi:hypothetical protein